MTRNDMIKIIGWLSLGFVVGFLASNLAGDSRSYDNRSEFNAAGFGSTQYQEMLAKIKAIDERSMVLVSAGGGDRTGQDKEYKAGWNDETQVWLKTPKSLAELYGQEAALQLEKLVALRAEAGIGRQKLMELDKEIRLIKEEASVWQQDKMKVLKDQIDALADDDRQGRVRLAAQMRALSVDYKLLPIKINDLKIGDQITIRSEQPIDWSKPVRLKWLMVEREIN